MHEQNANLIEFPSKPAFNDIEQMWHEIEFRWSGEDLGNLQSTWQALLRKFHAHFDVIMNRMGKIGRFDVAIKEATTEKELERLQAVTDAMRERYKKEIWKFALECFHDICMFEIELARINEDKAC